MLVDIGCCGAYCGKCKALSEKACGGCKYGYESRERDLTKARCKIKVCCLTSGYITCADCDEYESCFVVNGFYNKNGYKYGKYRKATLFIRANGYDAFLSAADQWTTVLGKLPL